jgi:hypothetical protein
MGEIEAYTVLDDSDLNKLASDVTAMIVEGWEPHGGIAVAVVDGKPV